MRIIPAVSRNCQSVQGSSCAAHNLKLVTDTPHGFEAPLPAGPHEAFRSAGTPFPFHFFAGRKWIPSARRREAAARLRAGVSAYALIRSPPRTCNRHPTRFEAPLLAGASSFSRRRLVCTSTVREVAEVVEAHTSSSSWFRVNTRLGKARW